ncbi:MAG: SDR family oxidoreductase [Deltaproteobacteria bacterium]|nr:SDR family oxidoreductase [Deltaproteobacteria bacterium]
MKAKRILITGASKGLGAVAAKAFASQGAHIALVARSGEHLERICQSCEFPERHRIFTTDLMQMTKIQSVVQEIKEFLGGIDIVLHAAGGGLGLREDLLGHEDFSKLFALNLGAAAEINRWVVPSMKDQNFGNLVHVGSIASSEGIGSVGYNTVKAALAAYVRSLGRELARFNIVATGILPGGFIAPENAMARLQENKPDVYQKFTEERLPRKKMGEAEELIPILTLLCSEGASMMGGCLVPIDAGEGRAYCA